MELVCRDRITGTVFDQVEAPESGANDVSRGYRISFRLRDKS
jgi:hypothetical protein